LLCGEHRSRTIRARSSGQHRIADGKTTRRHEAQSAYALAACVELRDVHLIAKLNAVESAGAAPDHIEVVERFKLMSLAGR
jgi:hypothetical protein